MQNQTPASSRWAMLPLDWWAHAARRMAVSGRLSPNNPCSGRPPTANADRDPPTRCIPVGSFATLFLHGTRHTPRIDVFSRSFRNHCGAQRTNRGDLLTRRSPQWGAGQCTSCTPDASLRGCHTRCALHAISGRTHSLEPQGETVESGPPPPPSRYHARLQT
jgi:hypothetical protein